MKHHFDLRDKKDLAKSEIQRIAIKISKTPTQKEYKLQVDTVIKLDQIICLFGTWNNAVIYSELETNSNTPPRNNITEDDLKREFIYIANQLGKFPSMNTFRLHSKYSYRPYLDRFNSWQNAITFYKENYYNDFSFEFSNVLDRVNIKNVLPKPLNLDIPLINTPSNEFETIVLFTLLAKELNIKILKVNAAFPDAVLVIDNKERRVEFEYLSSNYIQHAHPILPDILCICWRKDADIKGIEIFSLEEYIRNKK